MQLDALRLLRRPLITDHDCCYYCINMSSGDCSVKMSPGRDAADPRKTWAAARASGRKVLRCARRARPVGRSVQDAISARGGPCVRIRKVVGQHLGFTLEGTASRT